MSTAEKKTLPLYSREQLEKLFSAKERVWVTLKNRKVYDVTDFLEQHPGGGEIIAEYRGQDISKVMDDLDIHQHSSSSYDIMNDNYLVGYLATEYEVDKLLTNPDHIVEVEIEDEDIEGHHGGSNPYSEGTFVEKLPEAEAQLRIATFGNYWLLILIENFISIKFIDLDITVKGPLHCLVLGGWNL